MAEAPLWNLVWAGLLIGLIFSPIAAIMAFLITYEEYRHHFPDRAPAIRHATHMAMLALVAFLVLTVIAAVLVGHER